MAIKRRHIGIVINSMYKGFLLSLAKILAKDHQVWIIARDRFVRELAVDLVPELKEQIIVKEEFKPKTVDILKEAVLREKKYGETFSMLMSLDRGLGQGYLFNAEKHPHVVKSTWPHKRKIRAILNEFLFYDHVFEKCKFDLVVGYDRPVIFDLIIRYHMKKYLSVGIGKISDIHLWLENYFEEKEAYTRLIKEKLSDKIDDNRNIEYKLYDHFVHTKKELNYIYRYSYAIRQSIYMIMHQTYARLRGLHKKDGYVFCGWVPTLFRAARNYRYLLKLGKSPNELEGHRLVFFALHQEPEISLLNISPEFNNSMELISWVSKSLTADTLLVVKENPWSFGVRPKSYYYRLAKIPNLVWAQPDILSLEWIKNSSLVAAISGTVGFEAVYYNKPVLSFGKHQIINYLPTVRYVDKFFDTRRSIEMLLDLNPEDNIFNISKHALHEAQLEAGFRMPGFEKINDSSELHLDLAQIAVDRLYQEYSGFFS
jgi:hypothetical protein